MNARFLGFFIRRPRFALALSLVVVLAGLLLVPSVPVALYPTIVRPKIGVTCTYPGANACEVMNTVAGPIEEQVNGVEGMAFMTSGCTDSGAYDLTVFFQVGYDRDLALMKVQAKVQQALSLLPQEVKNTGVTVQSGSTEELGVLTLRSKSGRLSREELVDYAFGVVNPAILRVPGIGKSVVQDNRVAMRVWMDPRRMASLGIGTDEVVAAVKAQNVQASLGMVGSSPVGDTQSKMIALISKGRLTTPEEFEKIIVRTEKGGGLVRLGDIAKIERGLQGYTTTALFGGQDAVYIQIYQLPGVNNLGVMKAVKKQLHLLESTLPEDLVWDMTYDSTRYMIAALKKIARVFVGVLLLAILAAALYLRSLRAAGILLVTTLVPLAGAFACVVVSGFLFNVLVFYAFVLLVPFVVGLSALMIRKIRLVGAERAVQTRFPSLLAAACAVALPMIPLAFVDGVQGVLYRQFALVLGSGALLAALNALVLVPALAKRLVVEAEIVDSKTAAVAPPLPSLKAFAVVFTIALALGFAAFGLLARLPRAFIPDEDTGCMVVDCKTAEGRPMPRTVELMKKINERISKIEGVEKTATLVGSSIIFSATENNAKMNLILKDWDERSLTAREIAEQVKAAVADIPEASVFVIRPPAVAGFSLMSGVAVTIQSMEDNDPVRFANEAQRFLGVLSRSPLAEYVSCGTMADSPHLRVKVDREKCELMKVPMSSLYTTLQHYLGSVYVNDVNLGTQVNRVTLMSDWSGRATPESAAALYVRSQTGAMVPVDTLVEFSEELGVSACYRRDKFLYSGLGFVPKAGVSESEAIAEVQRLARENLPRGYFQWWNNLTYEQFASRGDTPLLIALSILAVYLVLVARMESLRRPILRLLPVVAALFGTALAHALTGASLSFFSTLSLVLLVFLAPAYSLLTAEDEPLSARLFLPLLSAVAFLPLFFATGPASVGSRSLGLSLSGGFLAYAAFLFLQSIPTFRKNR